MALSEATLKADILEIFEENKNDAGGKITLDTFAGKLSKILINNFKKATITIPAGTYVTLVTGGGGAPAAGVTNSVSIFNGAVS